MSCCSQYQNDIDKLKEENEVMHEALERIARRTMSMGYVSVSDMVKDLKRLAIDALVQIDGESSEFHS